SSRNSRRRVSSDAAKYPSGGKSRRGSTENRRRCNSAIPFSVRAPSAGEEGEKTATRSPFRTAEGRFGKVRTSFSAWKENLTLIRIAFPRASFRYERLDA